jgi:hypothetical protein
VRFLSNLFGGGSKGAVGNVSVSVSSATVAAAGSGALTVQKSNASLAHFLNDESGTAASGRANLTQPYAQSTWVGAAIGFVAQPIQAVPLMFSKDRRGGDVAYEDPALTAFWERPAKTRGGLMARADLIEASVAWLSLEGECFWIMDDTWMKRSLRKKSPLILARPCDMRPVLEGPARELVGWQWTAGSGQRISLIPEQVVHLKYYNPYDEVRGLAPWERARIASESDYAASVFARNLMLNNGDRGPYVIGKDGSASPEQIKQITAMLRQKRELSRRGDFRPVFMTGDIDVKEPGLSSVDTAYIAQRIENRHEILLAFGVPMSFGEVMASYSVGSASDRFRLIEDTCQPMGAKLCDGIEQVVKEFTGGMELFAEFDWDEHSTMQAVRRERIDSAVKVVQLGMPWKDASDYLKLKLPRFKGDDVGRVPFNLQEIGADEETNRGDAEVAEENAGKEEDPLEDLEKLFRGLPGVEGKGFRQDAGATGCACCDPEQKGEGKPNKQWAAAQAKRKPWVKKLKSIAGRLLMDARAETLEKLARAVAVDEGKAGDAGLESRGPSGKAVDVLSVIFDLGTWLPKWTKGLTDADKAMLEQAGFELWHDELGKPVDNPLVLPSTEVSIAIARRENRIRNAGVEVWERVQRDLQKAVNDGRPNSELAGAVKASFKGLTDHDALRIAQTETTVVYETGRDMTFRQAGVQWTQWLHSGLTDNARLTHQAAHLQIREMGEPFDIGGVPMMFPGDPDAPADEVINCKCVRGAVSGPDQEDIEGNDNDEIPF